MCKKSKFTVAVTKLWNKVIRSNLIPIVWGTILAMIITSVLASICILSIRWLLSLVGVIV